MKKLMIAAALMASAFAHAADVDACTKMGGRHVKPGTQKGKIAVIDTQSRASEKAFKDVIALLVKDTKFNVVYEKAARKDAPALRADSKADVAVVIVDDDKTPALLVAPEDFWAVMNVAKMGKGLAGDASKAKFDERCAKELVRAFSLACGGGGSQYPGNVMNCARQESLDAVPFNGLPMDRREAYSRFLGEIGVTPAKLAYYEEACQEGWAPRPKDKYQQEIWDEVHALPENPIKIKFDAKRDAGK